jgi:hypothetical protein
MQLKAIDRISAKKETFRENYYQQQIPCVFTDFTKDWGIRDWDYDFLKAKAGDDMVDLYGSAYESGQTLDTYIKPVQQLPFREYLDLMASNEESDLRLFLFDIFKNHPDLIDHIVDPEIGVNLLNYRFSFFGTKNSAARMHFDIDYSNVFLSHFLGRKKVLLFDRSQSFNLYQIPFSTHSLVDFSRLDDADYVAQFPNLEQLEGYETILEPGETIYMPSGYWHYITYVDSSFSVALRSLPARWDDLFYAVNNVFVKRNLTKALNMSPTLKRIVNDYKKRTLKKRYEHQELPV